MIDFSKKEFDPALTSINSRLAAQHDQLLFGVGYLGVGLDLSVKASGLTPLYVAVRTYLGKCSMIRCKLVLTKAADYRLYIRVLTSGILPDPKYVGKPKSRGKFLFASRSTNNIINWTSGNQIGVSTTFEFGSIANVM